MPTNEHRVYAYVRAAVKDHHKPTIDEVAQALAMPRSTVSWCARKLGFSDWHHFIRALLRYFSTPQGASQLDHDVNMVAQALLDQGQSLVLIDAVGDSEIGVEYVLNRFAEAGVHAEPYSLAAVQLAQRTQQCGVLIAINESGMTLLSSCLEALDAGLSVIAITASHDTPISKLASINVVIKNNKSDIEHYKPNYFTPAVLIFLEKVRANLAQRTQVPSNEERT